MINSLHIKLTRVRCIIAGLKPAFTNFADKLNDLLGQACLIAFGPDRRMILKERRSGTVRLIFGQAY